MSFDVLEKSMYELEIFLDDHDKSLDNLQKSSMTQKSLEWPCEFLDDLENSSMTW